MNSPRQIATSVHHLRAIAHRPATIEENEEIARSKLSRVEVFTVRHHNDASAFSGL
jgi:hypothetical protein